MIVCNFFYIYIFIIVFCKEWCGFNLGNFCNLVVDLNKEFGIYVCCIGCIGDISFFWLFNGCNFDDYLFGIGVLSCNFLYGCYGYVLIISSLYFSMYLRYGDY